MLSIKNVTCYVLCFKCVYDFCVCDVCVRVCVVCFFIIIIKTNIIIFYFEYIIVTIYIIYFFFHLHYALAYESVQTYVHNQLFSIFRFSIMPLLSVNWTSVKLKRTTKSESISSYTRTILRPFHFSATSTSSSLFMKVNFQIKYEKCQQSKLNKQRRIK